MPPNADHLQGVVPTQKLEWVTPKISLMDAGDTETKLQFGTEGQNITPKANFGVGPS